MQISPRRRQRALKVHELRQRGLSLRNIGKRLNVSHPTVLADLKLLETHWSEFTEQSTDDFQLEQLSLMEKRLRTLLQRDLLKEFGRLSPVDFVRIHEAHNHELAILLRETRRLTDQLRERADLRAAEPGEIPQEIDFPEDELTAAPVPAKSNKSDKSDKHAKQERTIKARETTNVNHGLPKRLPKPSKPDHSNHPIPSKTQEKTPPTPPEKIPNQPPAQLTPKQLYQEASTFLRNYNAKDLQTTIAAG